MRAFRHQQRGFTLIELMISVGIIGILATVAMPEYSRVVIRSRAAERATIMESLARAVNDTIAQQQRIPANKAHGDGSQWEGHDNPPGIPGGQKRAFDWTMDGWSQLPMMVQGSAYYSYSFDAQDPTLDGKTVTLTVTGWGDLDADGVPSLRTDAYVGLGYAFQRDPANCVAEVEGIF